MTTPTVPLVTRLDGHYGVGPIVWTLTCRPRSKDGSPDTHRGLTIHVHTTRRNRPAAKAIGREALITDLKLPHYRVESARITRTEGSR